MDSLMKGQTDGRSHMKLGFVSSPQYDTTSCECCGVTAIPQTSMFPMMLDTELLPEFTNLSLLNNECSYYTYFKKYKTKNLSNLTVLVLFKMQHIIFPGQVEEKAKVFKCRV